MPNIVAPVAVYRFFDTSGEVLYVGMTESPAARWRQHASTQPWWPEVARAEVEWHPSGPAAAIAERLAIQAELPRYNIAGMPDRVAALSIPALPADADALLARVATAAMLEDAAARTLGDLESELQEAIKVAVFAGLSADQVVAAHAEFVITESDLRGTVRNHEIARDKQRKAERMTALAAKRSR